MNILKRVTIQVKRNPLKTFSLFLLAFTLGTFVLTSMLIDDALDGVVEQLRMEIAPLTTPTSDNPILSEMGYTNLQLSQGYAAHYFPSITRTVVYEIAELPYVRDFDYSIFGGGLSPDLRPYIHQEIREQLHMQETELASFDMIGVARPEIVYIEYGNFDLVEGRTFTEGEIFNTSNSSAFPILVSDVFASYNGLSLGSKFNLYLNYFTPPEDFPTGLTMDEAMQVIWAYYETDDVFSLWAFEYEIVGIFAFTGNIPTDIDGLINHHQLTNTFYVPNWTFEERLEASLVGERNWNAVLLEEYQMEFENFEFLIEPYWLLYDVRDLDSFKEAADEILPGLFIIQDLSSTIEHVLSAIDNIALVSDHFLFLSLGAVLLIFSLLTLFYLRNKKHEIGIYLALGQSKRKMMIQIILEIGLITGLGILFSVFTGKLLSESMTHALLRQEITHHVIRDNAIEWESANMLAVRGFTPSVDELISTVRVTIDTEDILFFYSITFTTILFSISIPVIYTFKLPIVKLLASDKIQ